jgi:hypothetical protein
MTRTRPCTTKDADRLIRAAEIDAGYAAYDEHPLEEPDEWGDLASFRRAAAASRTTGEDAPEATRAVQEWSEVPRPMN